jgi:hypothetical protein
VCGQPLSLARPARSSRRLGKLKLVAEKRKKRKSGGRREKDRKKDISRDLLSSPKSGCAVNQTSKAIPVFVPNLNQSLKFLTVVRID